ncbi:MAG: hypothetical protein QOD99_2904 [Chthoniobacter sp.]|nr:hypothetical protein [Chthoniobacter sp.]
MGEATPNPERSLERRLANTVWVWFGSETIALLPGGKARWSGNDTNTFTWQVTDGAQRVIEGIANTGHKYKMTLDPNLQAETIKETDANDRPTARIRKK